MVRGQTGRTVLAWIVERRLAEARKLLYETALSMDAIAERVGYADSTYFIRQFRRAHGMTRRSGAASAGTRSRTPWSARAAARAAERRPGAGPTHAADRGLSGLGVTDTDSSRPVVTPAEPVIRCDTGE